MNHCPYCKSLHSSKDCPFYLKAIALSKIKTFLPKENFQSSSPAPFVGQFGYPDIRVGLLTPYEVKDDVWLYDAPKFWAQNSFQIPQIVNFRTSLLNSQQIVNIKQKQKIVDIGQQVAMADRPVELEVSLNDRPSFGIRFDANNAPTGPRAKLKNAEITSNPSIPTKVDKVVSDIDLKAVDALTYLYEHNFDETFLNKLLSVGTLGIGKNRKLVPTKWSITATDDALGKHLLKSVKDFATSDFCAFFGGYLGNFYLILFLSGNWSYELFEISLPNVKKTSLLDYSTDYETFDGRKEYAFDTAGGYYTVRLAILEKLLQMKRQSSALVIRVITDDYTIPLGVWVTREATRKALANKEINFSDNKLLAAYARVLLGKKFGLDVSKILSESKLLHEMKRQKKLTTFK